jgi:hypothetical protein
MKLSKLKMQAEDMAAFLGVCMLAAMGGLFIVMCTPFFWIGVIAITLIVKL